MERIEMSQEERDKLEWLKGAKDGVMTQREERTAGCASC